jgi:hypothetical protein
LPNPQLQLPVFCWNAPNSTFSNYQLHSARATFSICQIAPSKYLIFCPMPKTHSLGAQTRSLWDLFSTHPKPYTLNLVHQPLTRKATYPPRLPT